MRMRALGLPRPLLGPILISLFIAVVRICEREAEERRAAAADEKIPGHLAEEAPRDRQDPGY